MTVLQVLSYPNKRLRLKAKPISSFDNKLASFIDDMFDTMYDEEGVGLAATQVGALQRCFVMDISAERDHPEVFINPSFTPLVGQSGRVETMETEEGCLSVPDYRENVKRYSEIDVIFQDLQGETHKQTLTQLASICFQHELDHLNGKLFVDHLSLTKKRQFNKQLKEQMQVKDEQSLITP